MVRLIAAAGGVPEDETSIKLISAPSILGCDSSSIRAAYRG